MIYSKKYPRDNWTLEKTAQRLTRMDLNCCGVKEIHGIQNYHTFLKNGAGNYTYVHVTPPEIIRDVKVLQAEMGNARPFYVFSDNSERTHEGKNLADYVTANKLGGIIETPRLHNGNSGNDVRMYIWMVDNAALKAFTPELGDAGA